MTNCPLPKRALYEFEQWKAKAPGRNGREFFHLLLPSFSSSLFRCSLIFFTVPSHVVAQATKNVLIIFASFSLNVSVSDGRYISLTSSPRSDRGSGNLAWVSLAARNFFCSGLKLGRSVGRSDRRRRMAFSSASSAGTEWLSRQRREAPPNILGHAGSVEGEKRPFRVDRGGNSLPRASAIFP